VVGISEYQDPNVPKLKFTGADAQSFYERLVAPEQSGFAPANVRLLINEQATRRNIEKAISGWLFQSATADSTVVVFFAGHGGQESDKTGAEKDGVSKYLLPWDADPDDLFSSGLSNSRFHELLNTIKAQRLVVFMDACFAGGVTEGARDIGLVESPYKRLAEGRGRIVIASAQPNQRSWEDQTLGHGIFTYHLLEAMEGKADTDGDGCASVMDIFRYLQNTVPATARRMCQSIQEPLLFGDQISQDVVLTVSRQRMMAAVREREEADRLRSQQIKEKKAALFRLYDDGRIPLQTFQDAMPLIVKPPAEMSAEETRLARLLNPLLEGKISVDTYLAFAVPAKPPASGPEKVMLKPDPMPGPTAPPPVPPEHRRQVIQPVPEPERPVGPGAEVPKPLMRFCIYCGAKVIATNQFCINCGKAYRSGS
jgi:uncharacterized caspase-like protein